MVARSVPLLINDMKINIIRFVFAAVLLLLVGCGKDLDPSGGSITVEASIGPQTKVHYDGDASNFIEGDQIAVYAWTGSSSPVPTERVVDGVVNTLDGDGKWIPDALMRWKTMTDTHYFLSVSPVHAISNFTSGSFTLNTSDYTASDLLIATNLDGVTAANGAVALTFTHVMARLTVNILLRSQFVASDVSGVTVTARNGAVVNYLKKTVSVSGTTSALAIPAATSVPSGYTLSFSGPQVPQSGVRKITVTVAGKDYVYEAGEDISLVSGKHTTLGLIVGKDKIELSSVSVDGWGGLALITGGNAPLMTLNTINGHEYVEMGHDLKWATCNLGAENPWEAGDYFAWGELEPYYSHTAAGLVWKPGKSGGYAWSSYQWSDSAGTSMNKYNSTDNLSTLQAIDDAARQNWGSTWRMPTIDEWLILLKLSDYDWQWTRNYRNSGVAGWVVTSKVDGYEGNSIFLPFTRNYHGVFNINTSCSYWSSTLYVQGNNNAFRVGFDQDNHSTGIDVRAHGNSIRAVSN